MTFNLPREAAVRLQELARSGDNALINLGILSVQIANGEQLDLNAIRELLQQEMAPPPNILPSASQSTNATVEPLSHHDTEPVEQKQIATSQPFQTPLTLPAINYSQHQQSPKPPLRPMSGGSFLPSQAPISSPGFSHPQISVASSGMKSPFPISQSLSIGNIPTGIPSPHLGNVNKTSTTAGNLASSFPSVYSIAMPMGGNQRPPNQTPVLQNLPSLPTPQTPPIGNFPWSRGSKPSRFLATRPPSGIGPLNQMQMFSGPSNLPTNLPGSIPSIGPIPSPSTIPIPRQEAPPASKPKKKRVKRTRRPKEKIPAIPLPPPLMPPDPKPPPATEGLLPQKPPGLPLPIAMTPISPNEVPISAVKEVIPNPNITSVPQTQHTRFPFNQTQVLQTGRSDVSMTSPLLVNLLQSDFPSNQLPLSSGDQMKGTGTGPGLTSHRMPSATNVPPMTGASPTRHPGTGLPHLMIAVSQFQGPRNQPPSFHHSLQGTPRISLSQQGLSRESVRPDSMPKSSEHFQQPFFPQVPFPRGVPGGIPTNFNRFQMPQVNFPQSSPQHHIMQQSTSHIGSTEQRMQNQHTQSNWAGLPPTMTTVSSMIPSDSAVPTSVSTAGKRHTTQSPKLYARDQLVKSAFDEESALAGMTEAERDTFVAAAKIAQDSKPSITGVEAHTPDSALPRANLNHGKLPPVPASMDGFLAQGQHGKSPSHMFAIENLAVSDQQMSESMKNFSSLTGKEQRLERSSANVSHSFFPQVPSLTDGRKPSPHISMQTSQRATSITIDEVSNQNIDVSNVQTLPLSAVTQSKPASFQDKPAAHHGQTSQPPNPFLSLPRPVSSSPAFTPSFSEKSQQFVTSSGPTSRMPVPQGWPMSAIDTKAGDPFQFDNKQRGPNVDYHGKHTLQAPITPKLGNYPYDWPFPNISPPTQNLSSEGLQFMARLAAVPNETEPKTQEPSQFMSKEGQKVIKEDKPHLKALLNEISPSADGQTASSRSVKRLSSEEKSERKRRKSSPRPASEQIQTPAQAHGKVDQPSGSLELPRVPTAEELSFNLQQARAHSLDLLKSGTGYPPLPKSAPSSPRAKGRPKSVENQPQYGMQQSDVFQGKHTGCSSPGSAATGNTIKTTGTNSKSSGKSKESKSRSKSPKASGNKSHKVDQPGFAAVQPATTACSVPFAGVHEFHPPVGLNIRGPAKPGPLSFPSRKTPTPVNEQKGPMSPTLPTYGPKQFQQQGQFPSVESQRISSLSARPVSPFKSASALLSSFALSAGKVPDFAVTTPGPSQSPISSPRYVTSPPLHQVPATTISGNSGIETKADLHGYCDSLHESVTETNENLSGLHSPCTDPKIEVPPYPSEPIEISEAEQNHEHQIINFPFRSQSDVSPSLWKPANNTKTDRKEDNTTMRMPSEGCHMSTSSDVKNAQSTYYNLSKQEKETDRCHYQSDVSAAEKQEDSLDLITPDEKQKVNEGDAHLSSDSVPVSLSAGNSDTTLSENVPCQAQGKEATVKGENIVVCTEVQTTHTSVIGVSNQESNVGTVGVKKLGKSDDQYSSTSRTVVSVNENTAIETNQAFSTSMSCLSGTIHESNMSAAPLTRVTRVIPISSDSRIADKLPFFNTSQVLTTTQCSSEENPAIHVPPSISDTSRSTETVISTTLSGCGTPCFAPHIPNVISSSHTTVEDEKVDNTTAPKVSATHGPGLTSLSQDISTAPVSTINSIETAKSELQSVEKSDSINKSTSVGISFPVVPSVSQQLSLSDNSQLMIESYKKHKSVLSDDMPRPLQVASNVPPLVAENVVLQGASATTSTGTLATTQSTVDAIVESNTPGGNDEVDVSSLVGITATHSEDEGKWKDVEVKGTPHNFSPSETLGLHTCIVPVLTKSPRTADENVSVPTTCETSQKSDVVGGILTSTATSKETMPSITKNDLSLNLSSKRSPSPEKAMVQLSPTITEPFVQTVMPSDGEEKAEAIVMKATSKFEVTSDEINVESMIIQDSSTTDQKTTGEESITADTKLSSIVGESGVHCSMDHLQKSKTDEALAQKCHSDEDEIEDATQSDVEFMSLGNEALDPEFEIEHGEGTSHEDSIAMQIKNRIRGRRSPGLEAPEDSEEVQEDDMMPVTRKRSMRASGRGKLTFSLQVSPEKNSFFLAIT